MVIFGTHVLSIAYSPEPWNPKSRKSTTQDEQKTQRAGVEQREPGWSAQEEVWEKRGKQDMPLSLSIAFLPHGWVDMGLI